MAAHDAAGASQKGRWIGSALASRFDLGHNLVGRGSSAASVAVFTSDFWRLLRQSGPVALRAGLLMLEEIPSQCRRILDRREKVG
jgi:hypothetical protein